jgi:hypothetical protein
MTTQSDVFKALVEREMDEMLSGEMQANAVFLEWVRELVMREIDGATIVAAEPQPTPALVEVTEETESEILPALDAEEPTEAVQAVSSPSSVPTARGPKKGYKLNLTDAERAARGARLKAARDQKRSALAPRPEEQILTAQPAVNPCEEKARLYIRHQIDTHQGIDRATVAEMLDAEVWVARKFITETQDAITAERKPPRVSVRVGRMLSAAIHEDEDDEDDQ